MYTYIQGRPIIQVDETSDTFFLTAIYTHYSLFTPSAPRSAPGPPNSTL